MKKLLGILLYVSSLWSTENSPWIDTVLQPIWHISGTYQHFNKISTDHACQSYPGDGFFLDTGLIFAPAAEWQAEVEMYLSETHKRSFTFDHFKQTVKYAFYDDVVGDPFSLTLGISLQENWRRAVDDLSVIRHANLEAEVHIALGKEWSRGAYWCHRLWGFSALGVGEKGSPWIRGILNSSHNFTQKYLLAFELTAEMGMGGRSLNRHHFLGYGPVAYRFSDISLKGSYLGDSGVILELGLLQRIYSRNAPKSLKQIRLELIYPFNL